MKNERIVGRKLKGVLAATLLGMTCLAGAGAEQAAPVAGQIEELRRQVRELQLKFEEAQKAHQRELENLTKKIEALSAPAQPQTAKASDEAKQLEKELAAEMAAVGAGPTNATAPVATGFSPANPLRIGAAGAYMDLGVIGTFAAGSSTEKNIEGGTQLGGHDPNQRGFTVQGLELSLSGAVDPYFRGAANLLFSVDADGESFFELEEGWLETLQLPGNLQVRAGQLLTDFGRQNPTHPHTWGFVDSPLVLARFLGPDGLRNPGARVSWLAPTPFYSELFLTVQNSQGDTAWSFRRDDGSGHGHGSEQALPFAYRLAGNDRGVSRVSDMLFNPRYTASFDVSETQTLLLGGSAALGPNSRGDAHAGDTSTQVYGLDLTWKWKSPRQHAGFPFVSFQTEGLLRRYEAGSFDWDVDRDGIAGPGEMVDERNGTPALLAAETLTDYGFYSQLLYGFHRGWVAGLRLDYVTGDRADYESIPLSLNGETLGRDPQRSERWRLSPNLTWYPSEYSKLRLQYNYDDRHSLGEDHSVWLQFEFLLGAHAAHKF